MVVTQKRGRQEGEKGKLVYQIYDDESRFDFGW